MLAIAVASGKVGYVYLSDGQLQDWGIAVQVTKSTGDLVGYVQELINEHEPDVFVTEQCSKHCRKGANTRKLIAALAELATHNSVLDVAIPRVQRFASKYEEAEALAKDYPEATPYLPKQRRRIFDFEPRNMILFEALALAEDIQNGPPERLAAAMG